MKLSQAKSGHAYVIISCSASGRFRARLESLGLVSGETVKVLSASFAGLVIAIKGSRLAISKSVTRQFDVSETSAKLEVS